VTDALTLETLAAMVAELIRDVAALKTRVTALAGQGAPMSIGGPISISAGQTATCSIRATVGTPPVPTTVLPAVPTWVASNPAALVVTPSADSLTCTVSVVLGFPPGDAGTVHCVIGPLVDDLAYTVTPAVGQVADHFDIVSTTPA
jgi:hypothetical protein